MADAVFTGSYTAHSAIGQREDLQNAIFDISPMDTPFISGCSRGKAKATTHEWQTDVLADATSTNARIEGMDHTSVSAATPTVRMGNYLQISDKTVAVSGTLEAVDKAGRKSELAYQMAKRGKELKRDMESIVLYPNETSAGGSTTPRIMAGLPLWLSSNVDRETTVGAGASNDNSLGGIPDGPTAGDFSDSSTTRALTEALFKGVLRTAWTNGADPTTLMVGPYNKTVASTAFDGIAQQNVDVVRAAEAKPGLAIGAVDIYVSDFGVIRIIPNRFQRERDAWVLDFDYVGLAFLRPMKTIKLAKTGDAEKRLLLCEYTLVVKNEKALGVVADLSSA
jgi:hypothetical protein